MYYGIGRAGGTEPPDISWPSSPIGTVGCTACVLSRGEGAEGRRRRGGGGGEEEGGDVGYVRDCLPEVTLILGDFVGLEAAAATLIG